MAARPLAEVRRRLPALDTFGLAAEHYPGYRNETVAMHGVDVVLLTYIVRGRGRHVMGDHIFEESGGSLAVTHYGQEHALVTDARGMDVYNIYLNLDRFALPVLPAALRQVLPEVLPLHPHFQNKLNRQVRLQFSDPDPVTALIVRMHRELAEGRPGSEMVATDCLRILLIECCRQAIADGVEAFAGRGEGAAYLERVRRYLDAEYRREHNLAALARLAGVSSAHLCRAFKRYLGRNIFQYLQERRIQAAMLELRSSREKVLHVALSCGFNDVAHFNRTFRRMVGCTPTAYRRRSPVG